VIRSQHPAPFNALANAPSVRPWLGYGLAPLDLTAQVQNLANVCLLTPEHDGAYILIQLQPGLYEAHSMALPEARGSAMARLMRDGFQYMFTATDCVEVTTRCPDGNPAASRWADLAGFKASFRREACFPLADQIVGCSYRSLLYRDWVLKDGRNAHEGQRFHALLHAVQPDNHPDDRVHDAWVGATIEGIRRGNIQKAVALFNRWAVFAGYHPAEILSETPPVVFTGDAVVSLVDDQPHILRLVGAKPSPSETESREAA
jgi:hypothetical protein